MSENQELRRHIPKLDQTLFACLPKLESVKFGFLKLGSLCDASESSAFTSTNCDLKHITNKESKHFTWNFKSLFRVGYALLRKIEERHHPHVSLPARTIAPIIKLETFLEEKAQHEQSLAEMLLDDNPVPEGNLIVPFAEHLFKKLAPGQHCVIDDRTPENHLVCCSDKNCEPSSTIGNTDIGHKDVWHGAIDIGLSEEGNDNSPGKRNIIEVKTSKTKDDLQSMNQAIAQTIVFSFLQKKALPNLSFIPNILISPKEFRIIMYDVGNDILLCSEPLAIFCERKLKKKSIIMLWMVLHYELFLEDVKPRFEENGLDMRKFNAKFKKRAKDKIDVYLNDLEFATRNIQSKSKECFPSSAELSDGEDVFP